MILSIVSYKPVPPHDGTIILLLGQLWTGRGLNPFLVTKHNTVCHVQCVQQTQHNTTQPVQSRVPNAS
jgi:hypothetical protein